MNVTAEHKAITQLLHMKDCVTLAGTLIRRGDTAKARDLIACLVKLAHDAHRDLR
jgi:hypothetical protein